MQSKIRIEYDFDTKEPVLRFTQKFESDDLRDTMLKAFIEKATNTNSTLYFTFPEFSDRRDNSVVDLRCEINPLPPLIEEME